MNNKFIQQIKCWFTFLFIICSTFSAWGAYAQTAKVFLLFDFVGTFLVWLDFRESGLSVDELDDLIINMA